MKTLTLFLAISLQAVLTFAQNTVTTELFIEVPDQGKIIVYVDDEMVGSSKNLFRFYDVRNTNPTVTIMQNNKQIVKSKIQIKANYRSIVSYSKRSGLQVIKALSIFNNGRYSLDDWDGIINGSNSGTERPTNGRPTRSSNQVVRAMDDQTFSEFLSLLNKEAFENSKIKMANSVLSSSAITTNQLITVLKTFAFDDNKLILAKSAYPSIFDKENFFKVVGVFTFSQNKDQLLDYIKTVPVRS